LTLIYLRERIQKFPISLAKDSGPSRIDSPVTAPWWLFPSC
jgi:hypothetical protein